MNIESIDQSKFVAEHLNSRMDTLAANCNFSGTILLAHQGAVLFNKGYGYANLGTGELNQLNTAFRIASITKIFTSVAILKLLEQGHLQLNNKLSLYLSDFPRGDEITIHHLSSMTSGITNRMERIPFADQTKPINLTQLVNIIKQLKLEYEPGAKFNYSNLNYTILACIIEKVSGMSYAEFLHKYIFDPLGMRNSYVDDGSIKINQAIGYTLELGQLSPFKSPYDLSWAFGSGNIRSTSRDLFLFNNGLHNKILLNDELWNLMQTPIVQTGWDYWPQKGSSYGYGLVVNPNYNNELTLGHGGGIGSFSAYLFHFLSKNLNIVVLSNNDIFDLRSQEFFTNLEAIIFGEILDTQQ